MGGFVFLNMENRPGTVDELTRLYRETILKHAVSPVGFNVEIEPTHSHEVFNPLCGDRIQMMIRISGEIIEAIAFKGEACAICMASASLLCKHHSGDSVADFNASHDWLEASLSGETSDADHQELTPLLGVRAYPSRVKCVLLPWEAAENAIRG